MTIFNEEKQFHIFALPIYQNNIYFTILNISFNKSSIVIVYIFRKSNIPFNYYVCIIV